MLENVEKVEKFIKRKVIVEYSIRKNVMPLKCLANPPQYSRWECLRVRFQQGAGSIPVGVWSILLIFLEVTQQNRYDVYGNFFKNFKFKKFINFKKLQIFLNFQIKWIDDFAFSRLPMVQMLDISGNEIETLMPNTFFDSLLFTDRTVTRVLNIFGKKKLCKF